MKDMKLTESEVRTLYLIAEGFTDIAIAKREGISRRGVQNRISCLCTKLDVYAGGDGRHEEFSLRTRLVFTAQKLGLITIPGIEYSLRPDFIDASFEDSTPEQVNRYVASVTKYSQYVEDLPREYSNKHGQITTVRLRDADARR